MNVVNKVCIILQYYVHVCMININNNDGALFLYYSPMIALVVVSSVQFVLEAHQRTQIRMNIIVSVVVGLCLFSEVFSDTTKCNYTDIWFSDCTCGPADISTVGQCTSDQNVNQYSDQFDIKDVCSACTTCINKPTDDWWLPNPLASNLPLYILLDSLPVLILVPLILFFNIDLASGPGHSLVFMYQALVALFHIGTSNVYIDTCFDGLNLWILIVSGLPVLFNAPLQWFWHPQTLTHYSLGYVKVLIAGVLVAVSFFLATCTQCPLQCCRGPWAKLRRAVRNWRERHLPQRPVLTGVCSVAILMYGSLVEVSFRLLFRCELTDNVCQCTRYNFFTDVTYNATICCAHEHAATRSRCLDFKHYEQYLPYFIPAWIVVGVAVLLSLPFFYHPGVPALASYLTRGRVQLPRLHKLAPLFDVFQGVYKPKMQFFTGLYLLYRIVLWSAAAFAYNNYKMFSFLLLSVIILAVHSLFQPFESRRHNYVETLLMVNVVLIAVLYSFSFFLQLVNFGFDLFPMAGILANFPFFCVITYYTYKLIRRCCCPRRRGYHEIQAQDEVEEDGDSFQGERWEPPQDEAFH